MSEDLQFTGERFTPECVREIWYEHYHRYVFACALVRGMDVLDAASGEGYGSALLAETAHSVTGLDIDEAAVRHARQRYQADNLQFVSGSCLDLPFEDDRFDRIVSFETLEHLAEHDQLLSEFRRVLKPGGLLLISSPDKAIYTDKLGNANEFHVRELYRTEFEQLLKDHFPAYHLWGQKLVFQSMIWAFNESQGFGFHQQKDGHVKESARPAHEPVYFIALCAANQDALPGKMKALSLFDDAVESVYEHYYHEIRKNMAAGGLLAEKDRKIEVLEKRLAAAENSVPWWRRLFGRVR